MAAEFSDYEWLVSPAAIPWLKLAVEGRCAEVATLTKMRREISPARALWAFELVDIRERARVKFPRASEMFFTRQSLEQATDEHIAAYKAARFPQGAAVADLGCGSGGDFLALAARGPVTGIERNDVLALFAAANARALGFDQAQVLTAEVEKVDPCEYGAWHCDPDRRASGSRTTELEFSAPSLAELKRWRAAVPHAAIKLAPAAAVPSAWERDAELEWIGRDRECKQLMAWFGALALSPGARRATVIGSTGEVVCTFTGDPQVKAAPAEQLQRYLYEPHAAVLAAKLDGALAIAHDLRQIRRDVAYFTSEAPVQYAGLAGFEILETQHFDRRRLKARLRELGIGRLEIKKRGLQSDPAEIWRGLDLKGDSSAVLILTRGPEGHVLALIARRLVSEPEA